ncbi:FxSxx-COOH system tetratricopeptide repeat protein [Nonomuraea fuscirosea]|uniref:FxSxx-COOH system tetratricopeptide repeat protein n=1 Tax=Nonomuraea fuscirosea TaxID=1291556 RepID=UPI00378F4E98
MPPRNKNFTGREDLLERLYARMTAGSTGQVTVVLPKVLPQALHGLGGVGKTQMAVEFAYRYRHKYDLVWWISADQRVLIRSSLATLAPHLDLPSAAAIGVEDAANAALDALRRGEPYDRWLLVFDNADEPEEIRDVIPEGPGHVLIASRNHRWEDVVEAVPVDVFTREESIAFLAKRVRKAITPEDADRLAEQLGDLPLALEQAGALQAETGMSVDQYIELLHRHTGQLLDEGKPTEYPISMTAAWELSVSRLSERRPEAIDLLRCCAFFGPEPIPRDVFGQRVSGLNPRLSEILANPIKMSRAVGELGRFALARIDPTSRTIQVHRLIQALVRDELEPEERVTHLADVHRLLTGMPLGNPEESVNWGRHGGILGHVVPARVHESRDLKVRGFALDLARYLYTSGDPLLTWNALARSVRLSGHYAEACDLGEEALEYGLEYLGAEHPAYLLTAKDLSIAWRRLGELGKALEMCTDVHSRYVRRYGLDHPDTLAAAMSLANVQRNNGQEEEGLKLAADTVTRYPRIYGDDHPYTLACTGNLALLYRTCQEPAQALELNERILEKLEQRLGRNHHYYLTVAANLASDLSALGRHEEAVERGRDTHHRLAELVGANHPMALACAANLSADLNHLGTSDAMEEAEGLRQDLRSRYAQKLNLEHPDAVAFLEGRHLDLDFDPPPI